MDPRSTEGLKKSHGCLFFIPFHSSSSIFLRNSILLFPGFWHDGRWLEYLKTDRGFFPEKFSFAQIWAKKTKMTQWLQKMFLWILLLVFLGSNLKWKLLLLLIFQHQSHIWQNSGSPVMTTCCQPRYLHGSFKWNISVKKGMMYFFRHTDKHQSILQVDTIFLVVNKQVCLKYPKYVCIFLQYVQKSMGCENWFSDCR